MASLTSKMGSQSFRKTCNSCFKRFSVTPAKKSAFCKSCIFQVMDDFVGQAKEGTFFASEDKDEDESDFQSILCDMCDKNQFAAYYCRKCRCKLCCHCHNSHDTSQCSVTVSSSDTKSGRSSVDLQELCTKGKDQMKDMRQILDKHDQNLAEIKSQQKLLLVQMTDIHHERSAVQSKYDALKQELMCDEPSPAVLISILVTDEKMASMQEKTAAEIFKCIPPFSRGQEAFHSVAHSEFECNSESRDGHLSPAIASSDLISEAGSLQNQQLIDMLSRLEECVQELKKYESRKMESSNCSEHSSVDSLTATSSTRQDISQENGDSPIGSPIVGDPKDIQYKDVGVSSNDEFSLFSLDNWIRSRRPKVAGDVTKIDRTKIESENIFLHDRMPIRCSSYPLWRDNLAQRARKLELDAANKLLKTTERNS